MDYRQFLQDESEEYFLPYFGGDFVCDDRRSWRIRDKSLAPAWYRFRPAGRKLDAVETIEPELYKWKSRGLRGPFHGYHALDKFVGQDHQAILYDLPRDEDLPRFTPITAWEWFDASLCFDGVEFDSEVEMAVRDAFDKEEAIWQIKAVTPALANAFVLESAARQLAREAIRRREEDRLTRKLEAEAQVRQKRIGELEVSIEGRIALALSHSGAALLDWRRNGENQILVRYLVGAQSLECVIDANDLRIIDSGICLEGADRELNLSSLPSAVQEAIETGQLHVYRHG